MSKSKQARTIWREDGNDQLMHIGSEQRRLHDVRFAVHESELASISAIDLATRPRRQ